MKDVMSHLNDAIDSHISNGCFATFKKIKDLNGGTLDIPKNIIANKSAKKFIYEIDDDMINIYTEGIKEKSIKCPSYACRPLITMDIMINMAKMGLTAFLIQVLNLDSEVVPYPDDSVFQSKTAADLLDIPTGKRAEILEKELYTALEHFYEEQDFSFVKDNIRDGFNIISRYYIGRMNEA